MVITYSMYKQKDIEFYKEIDQLKAYNVLSTGKDLYIYKYKDIYEVYENKQGSKYLCDIKLNIDYVETRGD